jgi:hypothetical protein
MSRTDIKEFGDAIDEGEAALVIVAQSAVQAELEKAGLEAPTHVAKELEVDDSHIDEAVQSAAQEAG